MSHRISISLPEDLVEQAKPQIQEVCDQHHVPHNMSYLMRVALIDHLAKAGKPYTPKDHRRLERSTRAKKSRRVKTA
ncbi:MAG TPA: hypothetical protein VMB21_12990 [Candidatus Limnocylindria bacterium]|nr:hypothetical protein [Candidatus Limnocylindria bacterium]